MSLLEGSVGLKNLSDGARSEARLASGAELVVLQGHGRYHEAVSRGNVFHAAMQAGAALGTVLTAAAATVTLYNPAGSGVLLSVLNVSVGITSPPTTQAVLVYAVWSNPLAGPPAATTSASIRSCLLGPSTGKGQCFTQATMTALPTVARVLGSVSAAANAPVLNDEVSGGLVLPENTAVSIQNLGGAMAGIVAISWEEIPS